MLKSGPLFGVVGETFVAGKLPVRLERVGRPEIKNITMGIQGYDTVNRDLDIRDLYNSEDAFHLGHGYLGAYRARLTPTWHSGTVSMVTLPGRSTRAAPIRSPNCYSKISWSLTRQSRTQSRATSISRWTHCTGERTVPAEAVP